jgi:hypothetical protein
MAAVSGNCCHAKLQTPPRHIANVPALNPLDVLVIGGQDGLQLQLEGVRLHYGVCI